MSKIKFSLAAVFALIATAIFGWFFFLGINFLNKGDFQKSILMTLAVCLVLFLMVLVIKKIKSAKRNFQKNAIIELFLLLVYVMIAIITFVPFAHYFTVLSRKTEIKNKMDFGIDSVKKRFIDYKICADNSILLESGRLDIAILGKVPDPANYLAAGFTNNGIDDNVQKTTLLDNYKDDFLPAKYDTLKKYANNWLDDARSAFDKWKPISLMNVVNSIEKEANGWIAQIRGYNNKSASCIGGRFSFASVDKELTERSTPSLVPIIAGFGLFLVLLLPYFVANRSPRHPGLVSALLKRNNGGDDGPGKVL